VRNGASKEQLVHREPSLGCLHDSVVASHGKQETGCECMSVYSRNYGNGEAKKTLLDRMVIGCKKRSSMRIPLKIDYILGMKCGLFNKVG
jgi:hypothetical protein